MEHQQALLTLNVRVLVHQVHSISSLQVMVVLDSLYPVEQVVVYKL